MNFGVLTATMAGAFHCGLEKAELLVTGRFLHRNARLLPEPRLIHWPGLFIAKLLFPVPPDPPLIPSHRGASLPRAMLSYPHTP